MNTNKPSFARWRNSSPLLDFITLTLRALVLTNSVLWVVKCYLRLGSKGWPLST